MSAFKRHKKNETMAIGCIAALTMLLGWGAYTTWAACSDTAPSANTEACTTENDICRAQDSEMSCTTDYWHHYEVKEDFPKKCVENEGTNCNSPLRDCKAVVECIWDSEIQECKVDPDTEYSNWTQEKKNVEESCSS